MKVFINGTEDTQSYMGTTVKDLLEEVAQNKAFGGTFISHLKLDGQDVNIDSKEVLQTPTAKINSLEIEISSLSGLIIKNISNAEDYLAKLIPGIQKASELFHSGNEQEANQFFLKIIDGIEWFSQVVDTVLNIIGDSGGSLCFNKKSILERKHKILDLISQMVAANKNKDWVLLADLLEYEVLPYYSEWQLILPELKQTGLEKIN
ncbi:MAG: hypothetical protein A3K09_06760 [Nitrospinae bacterium RIFCSPLOWO2_12_FULL_47_7]|nr:MAG: hypothetical protein A3K09_06760 [Nitrospinae bacterium RIFCSPLOWO2_12_FULL_47_7]